MTIRKKTFPEITRSSRRQKVPGLSEIVQNAALLNAYYEHERDLVRFLSQRLKCAFTARDLVQELYLRLLNVENPEAIQNSRAYLFRVAANLATDYQRVEGRRAELLKENSQVLNAPVQNVSPERVALAREELERLGRIVEKMPPLSRKIFYLNRFEGKPQRAIAAELDVSVTTVEKHIRRVLEQLARARDEMEKKQPGKKRV